MGSGVMPLAMATRPSKAARDPAIPDVSPGGRLVERGPGLDPGPSPAGLVGGKRVVCRCRLNRRLAALFQWSLPLGVGAGSRSSD